MKGFPLMVTIPLTTVLFLFLLVCLGGHSLGDEPSKIEVTYDYDTQTLDVTITHSVGNPNEHYVYKVEITKNSGTPVEYSYTSQPSDYKWTYSYDVPAENGDTLKARAFCNEGGSRSKTITVEHADQPMDLVISPTVSILDENTTHTIDVYVESDGSPVEGAGLTVTSLYGEIGEIIESGGGDYSFIYSTPEVEADAPDAVNITVSKQGFITEYLNRTYVIHNLLENASTINITVSPEFSAVNEGSDTTFTASIESEGSPLAGGVFTALPSYGTVSDIREGDDGNGEYLFSYNTPQVNGDIRESIIISISKEGYETAYRIINFTIINGVSQEYKICIFLVSKTGFYAGYETDNETADEPDNWIAIDTGVIGLGTITNFTIVLEAGCEPVDGASVRISHLFGAVTNVLRSGEGRYEFTYFAPNDMVGESEVFGISAVQEGYRSNEEVFNFTLGRSPSSGGDEYLDGVISEGEYDFMTSFGEGDFEVHWRIDGDIITFAWLGRTTGWISLGLDPKKAMDEADMILAWVDDTGDVFIVDAYSKGPTGPHPPDTEMGGTDDIIAFWGSENDGITIIEFKRKLSTGDQYDKDIPTEGELKVIWSNGPTDDFYRIHEGSQVGTGYIIMDTGESAEEEKVDLWPVHAVFMGMGLIFMFSAFYIVRFERKEKWWLRYHRILGLLGASFTISGLVLGIYLVEVGTGEHFRVNHALGGILTILFAAVTPTLGLLMFRAKKRIKQMKSSHRWLGRLTLLLMMFMVISGLAAAGVI